MGENIRLWSTTAATNSTADSSINWAEGQAPSTVNDSARSMMATLAKHLSDTEGNLVTTGGTTAYLLTSSTVYTALASGITLCVRFNAANTGASTLNLDGLGAKSIRKFTSGAEGAVAANDLLTNNHYYLVYDTAVNSAAGGWILLNPSTVGSTTIATNSIDNTLLAQMATATLKGRATAGTGNAEDLTATQAFDALFSSTQGTLIYRNASAWTTLAPGTSGQVLKTNGAGANLSWTAAGGTGTVTSVATSGYVTGGSITTTGTISLGSMSAASRILGSGSGSSTITDLSAGTGISIGASSISNSGVTSNVAGTGIGVSGATGAVTITNNGVTSIIAGTGISRDVATGAVTISSTITNSGKINQIVQNSTGALATGTTTIPNDDTIPQNTEGDQYLSQAITPSSASSTLVIDVVLNASSNASQYFVAGLFQDATANALDIAFSYMTASAAPLQLKMTYKMAAGTTSATTFKVRAGGNVAGTTTINGVGGGRLYGGVLLSSLTITEILP